MDNKLFKNIVDEQLTICKNVLCNKSKEYDFGEDRLHSFKAAAAFLNSTPEEALLGYMTKHLMSISDMIHTVDKFTYKKFEEKITDTMNYLLLLKGLLYERESQKEGSKNETN